VCVVLVWSVALFYARRTPYFAFFFVASQVGNISSGNPPLRANYGNFNLSHTILIQGRAHERWKGWFAKFMVGGRRDLQRWFCKSLLPPPLSVPLNPHRVTQIEVSIVCMKRLVSTWYVASQVMPIIRKIVSYGNNDYTCGKANSYLHKLVAGRNPRCNLLRTSHFCG
jgi:hypothetical protein